MTEHTHKAFDADLQELSRMIAEMGGLAEREIGSAIDALSRHDADLSQSIIVEDAKIDLLQREIEEKAILTIARRQPMAIDLRDIVGALRVSNGFEQIGDLAKNHFLPPKANALYYEFEETGMNRQLDYTSPADGPISAVLLQQLFGAYPDRHPIP
jgi:phosphate transport system protein